MVKDLLPLLEAYSTAFDEEKLYRKLMLDWARQHPENCWRRELLAGHFTGSAWVLGPDRSKALLIHHRNLDKWVQPGGHADDTDASLVETARREATEECGLSGLRLLSEQIFDLDVHVIPAKREVPEHLHYDVRFLFQAENEAFVEDFAEVKAVRWVPLEEISSWGHSPWGQLQQSVRRMAEKCRRGL
jgi:8-oxo-dGTP pyrophosphatase MutT (NUDIX family)